MIFFSRKSSIAACSITTYVMQPFFSVLSCFKAFEEFKCQKFKVNEELIQGIS